MTHDPDAALVQRARAGDAAGREEIARRYRERVLRFAALILGDRDDAEDATQEALATALEKLGDFKGASRFSSWLFGIALNICRSRRRARREEAVDADRLDVAAAKRRSVLSSVIRRETADKVATAIDALPQVMREAFVLRFVEELDYPEIAMITAASEGAVRVRAHRARTLLQTELGRDFRTLFVQSRHSKTL